MDQEIAFYLFFNLFYIMALVLRLRALYCSFIVKSLPRFDVFLFLILGTKKSLPSAFTSTIESWHRLIGPSYIDG